MTGFGSGSICSEKSCTIAEDVLDEIECETLRRQVVKNYREHQQKGMGGLGKTSLAKSVCDAENTLLSNGADGSKIIVTTRSRRVADIMGTVPPHNLSLLGQEDCLSLFYKCAFKEGQMELYPNLVAIGKEIVAKCKQVPLAVINLGTQLYGKTDEKEWKSVRDSEKWEEEGDGILPALKISYQRLPPHLKRCFLYCSVFPKDYQYFSDLELVQFWMAHGLILQSSNPNEKLEDVGLRYVRELISRCFFQDYVEDDCTGAAFKMHDLMHDLASSLAQNEFSIISSQNHQISKTTRHLTILDSDSFFHKTLPEFPNNFHQVRSIFFADSIVGPTCKTDFEKWLPSTIALPEQFLQGSAESLQTFIIKKCPNIGEMPECIGNLKKLQNLEISDCPRLSKKCRRGTGEDWPKIKHIPKIKVTDDDSGEETSD
ncbi:disease resistance protein RGA2-like [Populus alba]|uniref:disease resistance protein RGA2-like n=1 Tax=Populus alba TaxID=43335 RepID=UPI003CC70689